MLDVLDFVIFGLLVELRLDAFLLASALRFKGLGTQLVIVCHAAGISRFHLFLLGEIFNGSVVLAVRAAMLVHSFHAGAQGAAWAVVSQVATAGFLEAGLWWNVMAGLT